MPLSTVLGAQSLIKPGVCTSSTRPASPYDGQVIYETDTNKTLAFNGSAWDILSDMGAWTAWTPTVTADSGSFTTVSATGRYVQSGKTVTGTAMITITTNGTAATAVKFTPPVSMSGNYTVGTSVGFGREGSVTGSSLNAEYRSALVIGVTKYDNTYPGANGYTLRITFVYEAA
jgi:hypothetical protein